MNMKSNKNLNKVMVSVWISNYSERDKSETTIVDRETFEKFLPIIKIIKEHAEENVWNWWKRLPEKWNDQEHKYEPDTWTIKNNFATNFKNTVSANLIIEFFKTFTPNGADGIFGIKAYEYKEIDIL